MTTLFEAPQEPTHGDVCIAVETLKNAGASVSTEAGTITIKLVVDNAPGDLSQ